MSIGCVEQTVWRLHYGINQVQSVRNCTILQKNACSIKRLRSLPNFWVLNSKISSKCRYQIWFLHKKIFRQCYKLVVSICKSLQLVNENTMFKRNTVCSVIHILCKTQHCTTNHTWDEGKTTLSSFWCSTPCLNKNMLTYLLLYVCQIWTDFNKNWEACPRINTNKTA